MNKATKVQQQFLALLRSGLWDTPADATLFDGATDTMGTTDVTDTTDPTGATDPTDWNAIFTHASRQTVMGLVAAGVASLPAALRPPAPVADRLRGIVTASIRSHALLNRTLAEAVMLLLRNDIRPVLLKGQGVAANYAEPTLRMCGDIDLYVGQKDYARACELARQWNAAEGDGNEEAPTESPKHYHFVHRGVTVELHRMAERLPLPWHNARFQRWTRRYLDEALDPGEKSPYILSPPVILNEVKDLDPRSTEQEILRYAQNDKESAQHDKEGTQHGKGTVQHDKGIVQNDKESAQHNKGTVQHDKAYKGNALRTITIERIPIPLPPVAFDALYIFNHAWHHFSQGGGIGLRQLCDWVRYLHTFRDEIDRTALRRDLRAFGLWHPWQTFATIAVDVLGLPREEYPFYTRRYARKASCIIKMIEAEGNFGFCDPSRTPRPDGYVAGKLHSLSRACRRYVRLFPLFPGETAVAWMRFVCTGIRRVVADRFAGKGTTDRFTLKRQQP